MSIQSIFENSKQELNIFSSYPKPNLRFWWDMDKFKGVAFNHVRCGTAISPSVVVNAWHFRHSTYFGLGTKLEFVSYKDRKHVVLQRKVIKVIRVNQYDIALNKLDSPLPDDFVYQLPSTDYVPPDSVMIVCDKEKKAHFRSCRSLRWATVPYPLPKDTLPYEALVGHDSGKPAFVVSPSGELLLASCHHYPTSGPNLSYHIDDINDAIQNRLGLSERATVWGQPQTSQSMGEIV